MFIHRDMLFTPIINKLAHMSQFCIEIRPRPVRMRNIKRNCLSPSALPTVGPLPAACRTCDCRQPGFSAVSLLSARTSDEKLPTLKF
jgi:hypothetical protein